MLQMQKKAWPDRLASFAARDVSLADRTTLRIGGYAGCFITPTNEREASEAVRWLASEDISFYVLGGGSNTLAADGAIDAPVISTTSLTSLEVDRSGDDIVICCGAGVEIKTLVRMSVENGWAGLEGVNGIPGTIGGAVIGNAGTKDGNISSAVASVRILDSYGTPKTLDANDVSWKYRSSSLMQMRGAIVTGVTIRLKRSDKEIVRDGVRRSMIARANQPMGARTAGCIFKNPPGDHAGRLLDAAGCKGLSVGGARVSEKHANFFVNDGGASAADMVSLIGMCAEIVFNRYGISLEREIKTLAM